MKCGREREGIAQRYLELVGLEYDQHKRPAALSDYLGRKERVR